MYDFLNNEKWYLCLKDIDAAFKKITMTCGRAGTPPITPEAVRAIKLPHVIVYDQMEDFSTAKPVYVIVNSVWIRIEDDSL